MLPESPVIAHRPPTIRSAITNDPLMLRGVDGRSVIARRYRDVAIALADDLGGQKTLNELTKILLRQAAALTVQVEYLQTKIVAGDDIEPMVKRALIPPGAEICLLIFLKTMTLRST